MSLPTGRQLLLFASLQLVVLWGVALLLARGVTPLSAENDRGPQSDVQVEWEVWGSPDHAVEVAYVQRAELGLSPAFWQRTGGSRDKQHRAERPGRWCASAYWIPGPLGTILLPVFEKKTCRTKREAAGPRS